MVAVVAALLFALVLSGPLADAVGSELGIGDTALKAWSIVKWPLLFVVVVFAIGLLFRISPDTRHEGLRWLLPGSALATVLWLLASAGFPTYVSHFGSYSNTYGSLAGIIVFLIWLWLSNSAILLGAQFAAELERTAPLLRASAYAADERFQSSLPSASENSASRRLKGRDAASGVLSKLEPMSEQVAIERLQAPPGPSRTFVRDLAEGDDVAAAFVVRERDRRTRKNGEDFIRLVIADRTGSMDAVAWEAVEECFDCSAPGSIVFVEGRFTVHPQYGSKITLKTIRAARPDEYDGDDLAEGPSASVEQLESELRELIATIQNPQLQTLLAQLFGAESRVYRRFREAPAAKYYHQAYRHGLLDHTVSVAQAVSAAAAPFRGSTATSRSLARCSTTSARSRRYNDRSARHRPHRRRTAARGVPLGYYLVRRTIEMIDGFDPELAQAILHIVLSHHGKLENGSPVVPATREAALVHAMDNLGGTLGSFDRIERQLPDGESWSRFDRDRLGRLLSLPARRVAVKNRRPRADRSRVTVGRKTATSLRRAFGRRSTRRRSASRSSRRPGALSAQPVAGRDLGLHR